MSKQRISIGLEEDLYIALAMEAEEAGRSIADVVRDRLRESVLGQGRQERVGEIAERLILDGLPDEEVLKQVLEALPEARTSKESVAWYRSKLRKEGQNVPSQVEAKRAWGAA